MSCSCIPLQFALMLVLTFAPCAGGVFLPSTGANTPLAHVVVLTFATCAGVVFPSSSWRKYSTCTCGGHQPLQLVLVVFFLSTTGANTLLALVQLALCGGGIYIYTPPAQVAAGCSNQMQLAQGHHLNADLALVLPAFGCCIPLQLALVVFFLPPTSENTPLAVMVVITRCNLRWWCFSLEH